MCHTSKPSQVRIQRCYVALTWKRFSVGWRSLSSRASQSSSLTSLLFLFNTSYSFGTQQRISRLTGPLSCSVRMWLSWYPTRIFRVRVGCGHLDWQLESATQIFGAIRTSFSTVEVLALGYARDSISSEWHDEADRSQWRELLRLFSNVKTLRGCSELINLLSFFTAGRRGMANGAVTRAGAARLSCTPRR